MAREENKTADALSKLALSSELARCIILEVRMTSCLKEAIVVEIDTEDLSRWMEEMIHNLETDKLSENTVEVKRIKRQRAEYLVLYRVLYTGEELIHS